VDDHQGFGCLAIPVLFAGMFVLCAQPRPIPTISDDKVDPVARIGDLLLMIAQSGHCEACPACPEYSRGGTEGSANDSPPRTRGSRAPSSPARPRCVTPAPALVHTGESGGPEAHLWARSRLAGKDRIPASAGMTCWVPFHIEWRPAPRNTREDTVVSFTPGGPAGECWNKPQQVLGPPDRCESNAIRWLTLGAGGSPPDSCQPLSASPGLDQRWVSHTK
jgi:hypothetical protein